MQLKYANFTTILVQKAYFGTQLRKIQVRNFDQGSENLVYSLRDVERRPVLCSFKRIEGGLSKKSLKKNPSLHPPLVRGFTAQHPCASPSQASSRVSRRFECLLTYVKSGRSADEVLTYLCKNSAASRPKYLLACVLAHMQYLKQYVLHKKYFVLT